MHEIVTIQLGSQANHVASHFWNAQESYFTYSAQDESPVDHDVHFRPGIGAGGAETYTPRAVMYDFKRNFGTMRRLNELYDAVEDHREASVWGGSLVPQTEPPLEQSTYQAALSEGVEPTGLTTTNVRYWSDYSRTYYHPRSVVQIYETDLDLGQRAFDDWESGAELYRALEGQEDLVDRDLRPFAEECDQMQGLQLLFGVENAWAGFTARYLDRVRDEYGKLPVWVWALGRRREFSGTLREFYVDMPALTMQMSRHFSIVNQAKAIHEISPQASVYVPLASSPTTLPSYVSMDKSHAWHTSALQETSFESALLPTRLKRTNGGTTTTLDHVAMGLSGGEEWKIAQASFRVDGTLKAHEHTNGDADDDPRMAPTTTAMTVPPPLIGGCDLFPERRRPDPSERIQEYAQVDCTRGEIEEQDETQDDEKDQHRHFRRLEFHSSLALPLLSSFPHIYSLRQTHAKFAAVRSTLRTSSLTAGWIQDLELACRLWVNVDEREELSDGLKTIRQTYVREFGDDEDEDWDD